MTDFLFLVMWIIITFKRGIEMIIYRVIKIILIVIALVILYLFALNGRYEKVYGPVFFDKWGKVLIEVRNTK